MITRWQHCVMQWSPGGSTKKPKYAFHIDRIQQNSTFTSTTLTVSTLQKNKGFLWSLINSVCLVNIWTLTNRLDASEVSLRECLPWRPQPGWGSGTSSAVEWASAPSTSGLMTLTVTTTHRWSNFAQVNCQTGSFIQITCTMYNRMTLDQSNLILLMCLVHLEQISGENVAFFLAILTRSKIQFICRKANLNTIKY